MTPKEKAIELVNKFAEYTKVFDDCDGWVNDEISSKQCALIAVDEVVKEVINRQVPIYNYDKAIDYWQEVKQEIQAL